MRSPTLSLMLNRRRLLGLGVMTTASAAVGSAAVAAAADENGSNPTTTPPATPQQVAARIDAIYRREIERAAGVWNSVITIAEPSGVLRSAVEDKADEPVEAYSVNKLGVATAVLDQIDRGRLTLDQKVPVTADIVVTGGDGIFPLDHAYPSSVTLGHVIANLLSISDDTAARLCGLVCPAKKINQILVAKGFPKTQVTPVDNPNRFFLGKTTPRETHQLLQALVKGSLLSPASTEFMLNILRSQVAFTDGIRRNMSTEERGRVATKAGWLADGRNEAGIMFDTAGQPVLTYALFARNPSDTDNFAATHPALQARARMGRDFFDTIGKLRGPASQKLHMWTYGPSNGGG